MRVIFDQIINNADQMIVDIDEILTMLIELCRFNYYVDLIIDEIDKMKDNYKRPGWICILKY